MTEVHRMFMERIRSLGAAGVAALPVSQIPFDLSFRDLCRANACGLYGRSWMCPPHVGEPEALMAKAREFQQAVVYQTVSTLEDSFDIEGMLAAGQRHDQLAQQIQALLRQSGEASLVLGAGCRLCAVCAKTVGEPCRFPGDAIAPLEAYCVDASRLAERCGLPYINGANTVTYFGLALLDRAGD